MSTVTLATPCLSADDLTDSGAVRLAGAILGRAAKEALSRDPAQAADAWGWILSPASARLASLLGVAGWPPSRAMLEKAKALRWGRDE